MMLFLNDRKIVVLKTRRLFIKGIKKNWTYKWCPFINCNPTIKPN